MCLQGAVISTLGLLVQNVSHLSLLKQRKSGKSRGRNRARRKLESFAVGRVTTVQVTTMPI
jgi:hypothetical protein